MGEKFNNTYRIESARLQGWDYRTPGYYFVTINSMNRRAWFGENINGKIMLNETGTIARDCWNNIPDHFPHVQIDEFVIMPDHVHGIVVLTHCTSRIDVKPARRDADPRRDAACCVSTGEIKKPAPGSLSAVIRSYKSAVTKTCREKGYAEFAWQARFYDRVIRDEVELHNTRQYIRDNPVKGVQGSRNE